MATQRDIESVLALSPLQRGLLFHTLLDPAQDPYFIQTGFTLTGDLELAAFAQAWSDLIERQAILRTGFAWRELSRPVQVVRRQASCSLDSQDWRGLDPLEQDRHLAEWLRADRARGFDLLKPPLLRLGLFRRGEQSWSFLISHHHLLLDGWSFARLLAEALAGYESRRAGRALAASGEPTFRDYLGWLEAQDQAQAERFFRAQLAAVSQPTPLPFAAAAGSSGAAGYSEQALSFSSAETRALGECARRLRVTLNTLVQGAWAILLARHAGQQEVVFGTTVSGRPAELEGSDTIIGLLINTLPLRVRVDAEQPLGRWLEQLQRSNAELRQYEWAPLSRIQSWSGVPNGRALFDSVLVFDSYPEPDAGSSPGGIEIRALELERLRAGQPNPGRNNYPLSLIVEPNAELRLLLSHQSARLEPGAGPRLLEQCRALLLLLLGSPERTLAELSWGGAGDASVSHGPARRFDGPSSVHGLFERHAALRPEAPAVVSESAALSYRELDRRAARLAAQLRALGVRAEGRVALLVERSPELIVAILGTLKAAGAYVPIDPKWPAERARQIIADSGARVVVYCSLHAERAAELGGASLCLSTLEQEPVAADPAARASEPVEPEQAAYLIYTSGSTGRPKGVVVEHRQLVNYVQAVLERLRLEPDARLGFVSTVAADLGHTSLFGALCSGRALHIISDDRSFDPNAFADHLERQPIDALKIVPSHLNALLEAARPERALPRACLVIGGETASRGLLERVRELRPQCRVVNHYGPTETTVGALTWELDPEQPPGPLPIGRPIANLQAYVLDAELRPVPEGVPGELYLGGAGVARGYHARPELTAERFLPDPHAGAFGQRLYRTGDRARQRNDGAIEFLGRTDHQIKLRGQRVELGEIEAALGETDGIQQAVVVVRSSKGADRLVAYVVPRNPAAFSSEATLRELARRLPEYMLPSQIVALAQLPLTRNGKIDRAALPESEAPSVPELRVAPRDELEAALAQIWSEILQQPEVGVHDNFFALGGDSIRSLQVLARARQRGIELTPRQLLEQPTIAALAGLVRGAVAAAATASALAAAPAAAQVSSAAASLSAPEAYPLSGLGPRELERLFGDAARPEDLYPLSPMQEGMLFHTLLSPTSGIYLMQQHYTWTGPLDRERLLRSWQRVVERHPILRTRFVWRDLERPLQAVEQSIDLAQVIEFGDLRALSPEQQAAQLGATLQSELEAGLPMDRAPLFRLRVLRLEHETYRIVRSFHHILTDDWCFSVMMMECLSFYQALERGEQLELPQPRPYRDYIAWLGQQDLAAAERFWRRELAGFATATPLGIERAAQGPAAESVGDEFASLSLETSRALRALAERHSLTPNTFVQGAWALLLRRYSGQDDVLFGVTVAGRPTELPGVENILGLFINSLPLRVQVDPERPLLDWLGELLAHNYRIREYEYPPLVAIQRWSELPKGQPLFHSLLVFENAPQDPNLGQQVEEVELGFEHDRVHTNYPLTLVAYPGEQFGLRLSYDDRILAGPDVRRMLGHLCQLLTRMAEQPGARIGSLELLSASERQALLAAPSAAALQPPLPSYVALFEACVRQHPDAVAVSSRGRALSYAELNRAANRAAHALRAQGVRRDTLVAVLDSRDIELVVAALGVFKAGGAYLPLDPSQPPARWREVLTLSRAPVVWTSKAWQAELAELPAARRPRILLRESLALEPVPDTDLGEAVLPQQLAYAIFTSGSTGVPKGALIEHAGMLNNVWGKLPALGLSTADVVGQTASQCFDISVWQLLSALLAGARVHIVPDEVVADPEQLVAEAARERISVLELVPSLLREVCDVKLPLPALRWMLPTGEALPPDLCGKWFAAHPHVPLMNAYGPAECSDDVALYVLDAAPQVELARVPIGHAVPNMQLHVVSGGGLAPLGVAGELCVAGVGVGRGYLHDPRRTALAFVPNPYSEQPGARLYRTGDLGLRRDDGCLECVGRRDQQVKVRGYRIELGEIEARLAHHPGVREAAVLAERALDGNRLVAYVAPHVGQVLEREELQRELRQSLPEYMVPRSFVLLPALPLTPNGKVDRRALPALAEPVQREAAAPARSPLEAAVLQIWQEVLGGAAAPGIFDNFFDLGGHSLLATRVMSRVRARWAIDLPLRALFEAPTAADFAARVAEARAQGRRSRALPALSAAARPERLPLSFAQRGLWFEQQLPQPPGAFVIPFLLEIEGALQPTALAEALQGLVARHEILRTAFHVERGEPFQVVLPALRVELPLCDLAGLERAEAEAALSARMAEIQGAGFDLARPPLLRAQLFVLAPDRHALALALHHIVADAWSIGILVRDLIDGYRRACRGVPGAAAALPVLHYADYALWQQRPELEALQPQQLEYWRRRLAGAVPQLALPGRGSGDAGAPRAERLRRRLARPIGEGLARLAEREATTPFLVLGAALAVLMHQQSGTTDLCIGTDVAGRPVPESEDIVGFFVNQLVLRVELDPDARFRELLAVHSRRALEAYEHQDLPFERLVAELADRRQSDHGSLFQLKLLMENAPQRDLELDGLSIVERELPPGGSEVELLINAQLSDGELELVVDFRRDLYAFEYVNDLTELYVELLERALQAPERRVSELVVALREREAQLAARARERRQAQLARARSGLGPRPRAPAAASAAPTPRSPSDPERNPSDV
jgi:amino acid adenylation domain-containing protein